MCTVTFVPFRNGILLTSNRDEQIVRAPALLPEKYRGETGDILLPKDGQAGGTWIALHNNGNAMVLLNGAFNKHAHNPPYRKSRGLIFLDVFDSHSPYTNFSTIDLNNIEPFTLIIWEGGELFEARWDGTSKYVTPLPVSEPRIWSSATLYNPEVRKKRRLLFDKWLMETSCRSAEEIRKFHEFAHYNDITVKMEGNGKLQTVSITGIEITNNKAVMHYKDMLGGLVSINEWHIQGVLRRS